MKLFPDYEIAPKIGQALLLIAILVSQSCATHQVQVGTATSQQSHTQTADPDKIAHTFYLLGDAGNTDSTKSQQLLAALEQRLMLADSSSTLLFLGDNIYPSGMPSEGSSMRKEAEQKLLQQLQLADHFKGKTIFIPGNCDWNNGVDGMHEQEKFVKKYLDKKKSFMPRKNCGIDHIDINDDISLIVIDSQWYLQDWNEYPKINEDCDIKTRAQFFLELDSELNKSQNKTTIIALHHPLMSSGSHGGQFSWRQQLFPFHNNIPLPIIGSIINLFRKTSGIDSEDLQNKKYNAFAKRVKTLVQDKSNVVVVSGHEHNLQYLEQQGIKQIISGSASEAEAARAINANDFSYGGNGYAMLQLQESGETNLTFFGLDASGNEKMLFKNQPLAARPKRILKTYPVSQAKIKDTAIYSPQMTSKSAVYRFFWGNHYRKYYSTPIKARVVNLDSLYGGLRPTIEGGGQQSVSLRLEDKEGKEYVLRALRKSATRFIQSVSVFKDQSVEKDFRDTYTENFILDFYTTSYPYGPFVVGNLAEKIGVNHTNPQLYYVPKQNSLGLHNDIFGDALYMIEERPSDEWSKLESFGKPDKIISTDDLRANLRDDEKYEVDEKAYIRARMFDMLIGDWDRHQDQWRWGEYKEKGRVIYRPIPRDRDQAFAKYDGALLTLLLKMPPLRHITKFSEDLKNVKWFNRSAHNLDLTLLKNANEKDWLEQAQYIESHLSDAAIDAAFDHLPEAVKDESFVKIKRQLKERKTHLESYARRYYKLLQRQVVIVGTDKKDKFVITRSGNKTRVEVSRLKKDGVEKVFDREYRSPKTREIWVYGLNDEDVFEVKGHGGRKIKLRIIGGLDNDSYQLDSGGKVTVYDFSSNNSIVNPKHAKIVLSNNYETNSYDYKKPQYNVFAGYPNIGFNPDDGVKMGAVVNYTVHGFNDFPYEQRHSVKGNYFFATNGFELGYKGIFPHAVGHWNFIIETMYTSPNFSINYFGMGNETINDEDGKGKDFNRVKIRTIKVAPSLQWTGQMGGSFTANVSAERLQIDPTPGRFVTLPGVLKQDVFDYKNFADANVEYRFENYDNASNPTLGMTFSVLGGYKMNLEQTQRRYPYGESSLGFNYRLSSSGRLVLATLLKGKALFDDAFEFYQAPTVGGDFDLRGFRNQRFSGKQTFYQSTDLRYNLGKLNSTVVPLTFGVFAGFDYGRAWLKDDQSDLWHRSVGGGLWINGINLLTAKISYFNSTDGARVSVGLGFGF